MKVLILLLLSSTVWSMQSSPYLNEFTPSALYYDWNRLVTIEILDSERFQNQGEVCHQAINTTNPVNVNTLIDSNRDGLVTDLSLLGPNAFGIEAIDLQRSIHDHGDRVEMQRYYERVVVGLDPGVDYRGLTIDQINETCEGILRLETIDLNALNNHMESHNGRVALARAHQQRVNNDDRLPGPRRLGRVILQAEDYVRHQLNSAYSD